MIFNITVTGCSRRTLAVGDLMVVEQCSCGSVHITIGAVTLRLEGDAIPSLAATLVEATRTMRREARGELVS